MKTGQNSGFWCCRKQSLRKLGYTKWVMCPIHPLVQPLLVCRVLTTVTPRAASVWVKVCFRRHAPLLASSHDALQCFHKYVSMHLFAIRTPFSLSFRLTLLDSQSAAAVLTKGKSTRCRLTSIYVMACKLSMMFIQYFTTLGNKTCIRNDSAERVRVSLCHGIDEPPFQALPTQRSLPLCVHVSFGTPETLRAYMQSHRQTPYSNLYATESCILHTRKPWKAELSIDRNSQVHFGWVN